MYAELYHATFTKPNSDGHKKLAVIILRISEKTLKPNENSSIPLKMYDVDSFLKRFCLPSHQK